MSASLSGDNAEPNLTPILDMVFQLITFFMLVTNFKARELDLLLKLPVVGSARPVKGDPSEQLLVLNIDEKGTLKIQGNVMKDIDKSIKQEAVASIMSAKASGKELKYGDELPAVVVVRADRNTSFKMLNKVIRACQDSGYRNFALKAMSAEDARKPENK